MLANHTKYQEITKEVADAIYRALADANQREALERYEERKAEEEWMRKTIQEQSKALEEKNIALQEKDNLIAELKKALAKQS